MIMPNLPPDLVEEILSKVPATSLKRLRYTCRRWNALIKDQRFSEKHSRKAAKESMVLMLKEYRVFPLSVNLNVSSPRLKFGGALGLKYSISKKKKVDIVNVFHCDGLLLCTTYDNRLVVWNPCLGETRWIYLKTDEKRKYFKFALGYTQNNKSCRSYKLLRWWNCYDFKLHGQVLRNDIYEFSSDTWRALDDIDCIIRYNNDSYSSGALSLKGNSYWVAYHKKKYGIHLLSFDFTTESFKHLRLPVFQNPGDLVTLSVGREEQLSVLSRKFIDNKVVMEMWVANRIDGEAELLWRKSFIVDYPIDHHHGNSFEVFTSLLISEEKKVSLCCNLGNSITGDLLYTIGEDNECYREISYQRNRWWPHDIWRPVIFHYVPSLFQIQEGGRKRKERN